MVTTGEHSDTILCNAIRSNMANAQMVIGVATMLTVLAAARQTLRLDIHITYGSRLGRWAPQ